LPYALGTLPGNLPHVSQRDIDGVLAAYATRAKYPVQSATLIEYRDWHCGQGASGLEPEFFRLRDLIAFCALAERRLFYGHMRYCNFDAYTMVAQRFEAGHAGNFSFVTRRRDGGSQNLWSAEEFAFVRPIHVPDRMSLELDEQLLIALIEHAPIGSNLHSAIVDFNRANTDSADVPLHVELVMVKCAFEFLFGIDPRDDSFARAVAERVPPRATDVYATRAEYGAWCARRPKGKRPLEAWAYEFCDWRGGAAHGKDRGGDRYIWSEMAHLAFASILFPLLVRDELVRVGVVKRDEKKTIELEFIEDYLAHDPFAPESYDKNHKNIWSTIYSDNVLGEFLRRQLEEEFEALVQRDRRL
jgi:hypothetical protein